jgi:hypothetical protein
VVSSLVWLWWVIDLARFEFESGTVQLFYHLPLVHLEKLCLFVSWCAGGRCGKAWAARIMAGVGDRMQRNGDSCTIWVLGGRAIEGSGGAVCGLHHACGDEEHGFLRWASKPMSMICEWFGLKTTQKVSSGLTLKSVATGFPVWSSKPAATVWWFGSQNQHDDFLIWSSKPSRLRFVGCTIKLREGWWRGKHVEIWRLASPGSKLHYDFPVCPQDWRMRNDGWCTWHDRGGCVQKFIQIWSSKRKFY